MSVRDLISAAYNKDAASFESTLHAVMQEKMAAAIQSHFSPAVYEEEVDLEEAKKSDKEDKEDDDEDEMCEDVDQIDELSDNKLIDYHAKAGADRKKAKAEVEKGMNAKNFTPASVQKTTDAYKRFIKRGKGMTAAANKMSE
jgi:hypothetical protein